MTDRDKKLLIGMGVVVGLALIWFLFLRGGGDEAATPVASGTPSAVASGASAAPVPSATPVTAPPPAPGGNLALGGRDPFSPLPPVSASPSPGSEVSPGASPAPTASPKPKDSADIEGYTVQILDVLSDGSAVDVSVDDTKYNNVAPAEKFGPKDYFEVTGIIDVCADLKYVKKSTTKNFSLCIKG